MSKTIAKCFAFFNGSRVCDSCPVKKDCKFGLVSVGFDIMRCVQSEMIVQLPQGQYTDADRMPVLVDQIIGLKLPEVSETLEIFDNLDADPDIDMGRIV